MAVALTSAVLELYLGGAWVDVSADRASSVPLVIRYGIAGTGPLDRIASTGTLQFALSNFAVGARPVGYYSPGHANCRAGFTHGALVRVRLTYSAVTYTKFIGKLHEIAPVAGQYGRRVVACTAVDWMDEIARFRARDLAPQVSATTDDLITAVIAAMPSGAQPQQAASLDAGIDTFPYAFDNLGAGTSGLALIADAVNSELGYFYLKGDGTPRFENRQTATISGSTLVALTDATLTSLEVPSTLDGTYNRARVTIHPRTVDTGNVVLFAQEASDVPSLAAGETRSFNFEYRNPSNALQLIGGTTFVDPLVATTDYTGNTAANGSGTNKTAALTVGCDFFASSATVTVENTDAGTVYLTKLQGRGLGIYDEAPQTFEATVTQSYGDRPLELDMPYQDDPNVGQDIATYMAGQFASTTGRAIAAAFRPHQSSTLMVAALSGEPGSLVTITEAMTGLVATSCRVQSVELTLTPPLRLSVRWGLAPQLVSDAGILDDAVRGLLDSTMIVAAA